MNYKKLGVLKVLEMNNYIAKVKRSLFNVTSVSVIWFSLELVVSKLCL